jgi:hypothetical protein
MTSRGHLFGRGIISAAIACALVAFAVPLAAQKTNLTLTGGTITFPAPTATDFVNGWVDAPTPVTFTLDATNGTSRTTTVSIRTTSINLGNGKVIADLQWRRGDLGVWNSITAANVQVEQRVLVRNGLNDPWSNTIFFRLLLDWTKDSPATYSGSYTITLSQTVP